MISIEMIYKQSSSIQTKKKSKKQKPVVNCPRVSNQETFLNTKIKTPYCLCFIVN